MLTDFINLVKDFSYLRVKPLFHSFPQAHSILLISLLFLLSCQTPEQPRPLSRDIRPTESFEGRVGAPFIDTHNHLFGGSRRDENYLGAGKTALSAMGNLGIRKMFLMAPPFSPDHPMVFDVEELLPVPRGSPDRFAILGGGGSLNTMIHHAHKEGVVSTELKERFRKRAVEILSKGAIGFGEFAVDHFSFAPDHPYESVPADHPLLLALADVAGERAAPIDIHMEAIPKDMPLPNRTVLTRSGRNPSMLRANLSAFERLLGHNRRAPVIWAHAGWCNTGYRTADLCRELLSRNPNLYMSIKLSPESVQETRPITPDQKSIRPEWLELFREFPDRFVIGTDQFYGPPGARQIGPQKTEAMRVFMDLLPQDMARQIGIDNPIRLFHLETPTTKSTKETK
ncbi:MAG: hypothetical protein C4576_27510 [Desulfobacteraceae bacterium]|nr:MAG: hypothetical protein C4576_27510 [Desulfobacteraceae bacterium]